MAGGSKGQSGKLLRLDVCVDEQEPRSGVMDLLGKLRPDWRREEIQIKVFTEGLTNQLMGCFVGSLQLGGAVLVRVYGRMTDLYVDRDREVEMFQLLHAHGCGPQIYCGFQNGICYEFVTGSVMDDIMLRQPAIYRLIATEMGRIHSIKPKPGSPAEPVLWKKVTQFLQLVQSSHGDKPVEQGTAPPRAALSAEILSEELEKLRRHLGEIDSATVLCHNDLLTKNIIYNQTENSVRFIDYEYADYNYQAFDIGNHFNEFAGMSNTDYSLYPSRELQRDWLTVYLESYKHSTGERTEVSAEEVQQLYVQVCKFSLVSHFFWGLWAILQARYSSIEFDFHKYATARFKYYFEKRDEYFRM